jgi:hypothetical protein
MLRLKKKWVCGLPAPPVPFPLPSSLHLHSPLALSHSHAGRRRRRRRDCLARPIIDTGPSAFRLPASGGAGGRWRCPSPFPLPCTSTRHSPLALLHSHAGRRRRRRRDCLARAIIDYWPFRLPASGFRLPVVPVAGGPCHPPFHPRGPAARSMRHGAEISHHRAPHGPAQGGGWAGMGVVRGGGNLAPGPLGLVAGDPDRHWGWLLCPSSVLAAAGRGLRPRVVSSHRPWPQLQVHALPGMCCNSHPLAKHLQSGHAFLLHSRPFPQSGQILCRFRLALQRKSGPRIALPAHRLYYPPSRYMASVDHMPHGAFAVIALRGAPWSHSARACSNGRPSDRLRFFMCGLGICGSSAGQSRRKKRPPPSRQSESHVAVCMPVASKEAI